jgi:HD-GYP domain-containing protein (c-di-GMP phosphodiesterase class II)
VLKTLKVPTVDLDIGMYVSGLDRPWLGTPFVTQGFFIESADDIERLRQHCDWVLVDSRRSHKPKVLRPKPVRSPETGAGTDKNRLERRRVPIKQIFHGRTIAPYSDDTYWEDEQPLANEALDTLVHDIDDMFGDVSGGQKLNVIRLRKSVEPVVDSISRNPDACLWVARLKRHDKYTYKHSLGASIWAVSMGRQLGLPRHDLRSLAMGCMLMDVGKLRVDQELLQADRELNVEEMAEVASHVNHGLDILQESGVMNQDVLDMVAHHHERYDGSGYPAGLHNNQIPPFARIAGIVDTYDAITTARSYADALSPSDAIKVLYRARDLDFQAELVEAFIQAIGIYPAGTLVELSSGEVGVVVAEYRTRRLRPKVMILLDEKKRQLRKSRVIDLQELSAANGNLPLSIVRSLEPEAFGIDLADVASRIAPVS